MASTAQNKTHNLGTSSKLSNLKPSTSSESTAPKPSSSSEDGPFIQKTRKKRNIKGQNVISPQTQAKSYLAQTVRNTPSIPEQPSSTKLPPGPSNNHVNSNVHFNNTAHSRPLSTYGLRENHRSQHPGGHYNIQSATPNNSNNNGKFTQRFQTREWTNSTSRKSSLSDLSVNSTSSNHGRNVPPKSAFQLDQVEKPKLVLPERPSTPSGSQTSRSHSSWASVLKPGLIEVPDGLKADVFGYEETPSEPAEEPILNRPAIGNNQMSKISSHDQSQNRAGFSKLPVNLQGGTSLLGDVPVHLVTAGVHYFGDFGPHTGPRNTRQQSGRNTFAPNNNDAQRHNANRKSKKPNQQTMDSPPGPSYEPQTKKRSNESLHAFSSPPVNPHVDIQQSRNHRPSPRVPEHEQISAEDTTETTIKTDTSETTEISEISESQNVTVESDFDSTSPSLQTHQEYPTVDETEETPQVQEMAVETEPLSIDTDSADPPEASIEPVEPKVHLLETSWTLYHMNLATKKKGSDWNSGMQSVGVFDTVEAFFHGYHTTPKASETGKAQDYMFFRGGKGPYKEYPVIGAAWEDPRNSDGGLWRFNLPVPRGNTASPVVDFFWKEILMALVGEQFGDHNDMVNGCYFCNRGDEYRLQVWMGCNDPKSVTAVGVRLAELLDLRENFYFDYCSHKEIHQKGNRYAKPLYENQDILRMLATKRNSAVKTS